ncbi:hypothetical protein SAMN04487947_3537 [Halogeometricum rufum]|uniref:Phage protein D n=1 Tax=Halogeometricum rufum TaxID=553469 RepID=A0A1I6IQH4_9EURY|nr:phage late control D family protein [Halogeometricum rufum]SFR68983.1 hypothetical protein SAMN04487947_3537 [Halogeometricum rufum]
MSLADVREKYGDFYVPRFVVEAGDTTFTEASGVVSQLSVSTSVDSAERFSFSLNNLYDQESREFEGIDWGLIDSDSPVTVSLGYGDTLVPMVVGTVESAEPKFPADGVPTVDVSGYGRLHELMTGTNTETWDRDTVEDRVTDSNVVRKVLERGGYGFSKVVIDETDLEFPRIVQDNKTDYQFVKQRAKRYNYEVFVTTDAFHFREPREDRSADFELAYGESLRSFSPRLNRARDVSRVNVRWNDRNGREVIEGSAEGADPNGDARDLRMPVESPAEAETVAASEAARIRQGRLTGRGETIGVPELVAGITVELDGVTETFNGRYYVESADHQISTSGYTTTFQVRKRKGGTT